MKLKAQLKKTSLLGRAGSLLQRTAPFRRNKK